ncbi:MAG: hypothetical protein ACLFOY_10725 [Desulfatibacillaceae bacterium]
MHRHLTILATAVAMLFFCAASAAAMGSAPPPTWPEQHAIDNHDLMSDGLGGWNILQDDYRAFHYLDGLSLEWDYYSLHDDDGDFTGVVGNVVADPKGHIGGYRYFFTPNLMPSGVNTAFYGKFAGEPAFAIYIPFGLGHQIGKNERTLYASDDQGRWTKMTPVRAANGQPDRIILEGDCGPYSWNLTVSAMWPEYAALKPDTWEIGNDTEGILCDEHWTVNMIWPTTKVTGQVVKDATGEVVEIDGHGYRENSFGRWAFVAGGWDFAFMSDPDTRVQWAFQTYHFNTGDLDFVDVDFMDNGNPVTQQFAVDAGELGWYHDDWTYDTTARQYVPKNLRVVGKNDQYTVEATVTINDDYAPMLSDVTPVVSTYCIFAQMPWVTGTITRSSTGEVVATFDGQGGGEFSLLRNFGENAPWGHTPEFFSSKFQSAFPR